LTEPQGKIILFWIEGIGPIRKALRLAGGFLHFGRR
jgi:hypothetical protein